jgi:hypothetical protein
MEPFRQPIIRMGPIAHRATAPLASKLDDHAGTPLHAQIDRHEKTAALVFPIARDLVHVQSVEALRAVISDARAAEGHICTTVGTLKRFVPSNWIGSNLRSSTPVKKCLHETLTVQVRHPLDATHASDHLRRRPRGRVRVQHSAKGLDLTPSANRCNLVFQDTSFHRR